MSNFESSSEEDCSGISKKDASESEHKVDDDDDKDLCFNPFAANNNRLLSDEDFFSFNPFSVHSDENVLNSTVSFNPLSDTDDRCKSLDISDCSPVGHVKERKTIVCDHCGKTFNNRYNMKQHLIRTISQILKMCKSSKS